MTVSKAIQQDRQELLNGQLKQYIILLHNQSDEKYWVYINEL